MEITDEIRELILIGASALELRKKAIDDGMISLRESGLYKIRAGVTTPEGDSRSGRLIEEKPEHAKNNCNIADPGAVSGRLDAATHEAHGVRRRVHRLEQRSGIIAIAQRPGGDATARMRQRRLAAELAHRKQMLTLPTNISVGDLSGLFGPALPSLPAISTETTTLPPRDGCQYAKCFGERECSNVASVSNGATRPKL